MSLNPIVTIVTPTHNRLSMLKETVNSIKAQTYRNWEHIIVDDASTRETQEWLESVKDDRVKTIRLSVSGERANARNIGLKAAAGTLILFLDDDDLLFPEALSTHVNALTTSPKAIASIGGYEIFRENMVTSRNRIIRKKTLRRIHTDILFGWMAVSGQCVFRTEIVRSFNGWEGKYIPIEDHVFWLHASTLGPAVLIPEIVMRYRIHSAQSRPENIDDMMAEVRENAVEQNQEMMANQSRRILEARRFYVQADHHFTDMEAGKALRLYLKAIRTAPEILRSPLIRAMIVLPALYCLTGTIGLRIGRKIRSRQKGSQE